MTNVIKIIVYTGVEFQRNGMFIVIAALFAIKRICSFGNFEYPSTYMLMTLVNEYLYQS